ncbi:MAG: PAS domain-containing sensor histidine kinase [Ignavibacteriaceae bacterium]
MFLNLSNPVIFSVIITLALLGVIYIFYIYILKPVRQSHLLVGIHPFGKKQNLELQNSKLMASFAELDPDPLFRFNLDGKIIFANDAGHRLHNNLDPSNRLEIIGLPVNLIFPDLPNLDYKDFISSGKTYQYSTQINDSYFTLILKGVPEIGFGQLYCNNISEQKKIEEELILSRKNLRNLSHHIQKLQEEEKQKISRELHDGLGQILTSIKLNIEVIKNISIDREDKSERFKDISNLIDIAITEVKDMSYQLKSRILDDFGLVPSLNTLCNEVSKKSGIAGNFKSFKLNDRLKPDIETVLYRIVQEGLNNIVKHSQAKEFSVQLVKYPSFIRLMIEDDGVGFDADQITNDRSKQKCMGLININERALSINGKVIIDSQKGAGTEVIVEIPLEDKDE